MNALFAQVLRGPVAAWSIVDWVIVIGIMYIALGVFGVQIPPWAIKMFWIVCAAALAIIAIRFLVSL